MAVSAYDRRVCERKARYPNKARAREARSRLRRTHPGADFYECPCCGGWHITKMRTEVDRLNRRRVPGL